jgi:hypothetical protein
MTILGARLQTVRVDEPVQSGNLQVFGLRWEPGDGPAYTTLDDGLAAALLEVTEVSDGGSVPTLKVHNKGDALAFLMAGEQLAGGKQNRVLNASILVAPHSELPIPVSCVERGRWAYRGPRFGSAGSSSHSKLRKMMHLHATESYRSLGTPTSKQGEVWQEVDRKLQETGSHSDTAMLEQAYLDTQAVLSGDVGALTPPDGVSGAVFAYGGKVVGFDLFDRPATLAKLWPKLVRAYALDAYVTKEASGRTVTRDEVEAWLRQAADAKEEVFKSPGVGDDVRVQGKELVAAGLVIDERPVHVEAFAEVGSAEQPVST